MFDFESLYKTYPNKEGKRLGMDKLAKIIKTEAEFEAFKTALANYLELCRLTGRIEGGYVKQWKTFINNFTDYLDPEILSSFKQVQGPSGKNLSQLERITKGDL